MKKLAARILGRPRGWNLARAPAGSSFVLLSRGRTRYRLEGPSEGPLLLLVHGMTYPLEVWNMQVPALVGAGFRVLRYDLWGRGFSEFKRGRLDLEILARQPLELLQVLGEGGAVHACSLSNSDLVLSRLFRLAPARLRSITWISPSAYDPRTQKASIRFMGALPLLRGLLARRLRRTLVGRMEGHRAGLPSGVSSEVLDVYAASLACARESPVFAAAVVKALRHLPSAAAMSRDFHLLAQSDLPLLALRFGGEQDADPATLERTLETIPQLEQVQIPGGGHMGLLDEAPAVNAALLSFLARRKAG